MAHMDGIGPNSINRPNNTKKQETPKNIPQNTEPAKSENPDILKNDPAQVLGRSQVQKSQKMNPANFKPEDVKAIQEALNEMMKNPELTKKSEAAFKGAFKKAVAKGSANPYAEAVNVQTNYVKEFKN